MPPVMPTAIITWTTPVVGECWTHNSPVTVAVNAGAADFESCWKSVLVANGRKFNVDERDVSA